jgi:hypothetical protein
MRILLIAIFFLSLVQSQTLVSTDQAVEDSLNVLLQDWSLAEMEVEQAIKSQMPVTAAARKARLKSIYEARVVLASAEQRYYLFCTAYAPDQDSRMLFSMRSAAAKRRRDGYQAQVYAYTAP